MEKVSGFIATKDLILLPEAEREVIGYNNLYGKDHSKVYVGSEAREHRIKNEAESIPMFCIWLLTES